jgi:hypothetical protein
MDKNRIVTYSLLAHINNHGKGIKDFSDIFLPLVKRTLSKLNSNGITSGLLTDVKNEMDRLYSLDIPFPLLNKNIKKIADEYNTEAQKDFQVHKDGSFVIHKFLFSEYEEIISQQEVDIEAVNLAYEKYLQANEIDIKGQPSLFDFLDKHRIALSNFFATKTEAIVEEEKYLAQASFVNEIKGVKELFEILKRIYLGSIITSYLEVDYGQGNNNNLEFVLDTTFLVSYLNLHSLEAKHTCDKIIEICHRLEYKVTVLRDTIEEAQGLLRRTSEYFNNNYLAQKIDVNSIYNACDRLSLNKTDIERISANLEKTLNDRNIIIISNTDKYKNLAKFSKEYEVLKNRKSNPGGALHDAVAIIYVQQKRGKKIKSFYDGKCWFVTDMKNDLYQAENRSGEHFLSESIRADELVNILWLSNPNVKTNDIIDIGLTRLVANTISESLPNPRLLKELDDNIQKYAKDKIDPSDCVRVANMIANRTLTNLEQLNKVAKSNPEEFVLQLKELSSKSKTEEARKEKFTKDLITNIHTDFEKRFTERDTVLKSRYEAELDDAKKQILSGKEGELLEQQIQKNKQIIESKENEVLAYQKQIDTLSINKKNCDLSADDYSRNILLLILLVLVLIYIIFGYLLNKADWNKIEPLTYFIGSPILVYILYFIAAICFPKLHLSFDPRTIKASLKERGILKNYKKWNFDLEHYEIITDKIANITLDIENLKRIEKGG